MDQIDLHTPPFAQILHVFPEQSSVDSLSCVWQPYVSRGGRDNIDMPITVAVGSAFHRVCSRSHAGPRAAHHS
jgi:hypothetical protein